MACVVGVVVVGVVELRSTDQVKKKKESTRHVIC